LEVASRKFIEAKQRHLYLALANLPVKFFDLSASNIKPYQDTIQCLRSVLQCLLLQKEISGISSCFIEISHE